MKNKPKPAHYLSAMKAPKPKASALTVCTDCREAISKAAPVCPHCGSPQKAAKRTVGRSLGRIFSLLAVIVLGLAAIGYYRMEDDSYIVATTLAATAAVVFCFLEFKR
jgi:hypothetical protein